MSRATHARFLRRQSEERERALDCVVAKCTVCSVDITGRDRRDGRAYVEGPGVVLCGGESCARALEGED